MLNSEKKPDKAATEALRKYLAECREEKNLLENRILMLNESIASHEENERDLLKRLYLNEKTGLPNHTYLYRDGAHVFSPKNNDAAEKIAALMFIALDETYEVIKKTQASAVSEWILYKTALWIREIIGDSGKVYQSGSTEFAVILRKVDGPEHCAALAESIYHKLLETHRFPGTQLTIGCSIGCAVYPIHGNEKALIFRNADIALLECKKRKIPWVVFDSSMADEMMERIDLRNGILKALEEQALQEMESQFDLNYQPLVRVASLNGRGLHHHVVGAECLIRWNHPTFGPVSPARFIPLAEESGLIIPIGNWVFYNSTKQLKEYQEMGYDSLYMSINLSPRQFNDPFLVKNIERVLGQRSLRPESIQLEITETSVMDDPEDAKKKLNMIQDMGIKLSIDDFGTGYSSLSYLKDLSVDSLKIDKSFIDEVVTNTQNQGIVRAVISMARSLGLDILAEGIEDFGQLEFIHNEGCKNIQGYYFSKPLTAGEFSTYLSAN